MKKFKITRGDRVYIVDAKSHIDAISKVKSVKTDEVRDSISQWKPGMSEIGLFQISYKKGTVYQSILVKAATKEDAINKFTKHKPDAEVIGVNEYPNPHFGEPILDSSIKDGSYGAFTMNINSLDDINLTNLVKSIRDYIKQHWNSDIAEINTDDVTTSSGSPKLNFSFREKRSSDKNGRWELSTGTIVIEPSYSLVDKYYTENKKYGEKKLNSEIANKLKQYAHKTIYKNASITRDSAIKDAYIEEWYENTNENPYMVAKRYGVSVKPIKKRGADVLYRFEGTIDKLNRMHSDGYFMSIDMAGNSIKDEWSGIRSNGVIFNYSNGKYTITHKNGKVETFPGNKFNTAEELFKYIDNIKDSAIKDEDYSKYLSIVKQLEKLVEPANRALQQKIAKYGVTKQDIRNNSPKYRDVCREIPELKVWAKLIMQLPGELAGFMSAHPSQESVDKLKKAVTNSKAFDSTIK